MKQQQEVFSSFADYDRSRAVLFAGYDALVRRTLPLFVVHHLRPTSLTLSSAIIPGYYEEWDRDEEWQGHGTTLWLNMCRYRHASWCERTAAAIPHAFGAAALAALRAWQAGHPHDDNNNADAICAALVPLLCDSVHVLLATTYLPTLFHTYFEVPIDGCDGHALSPRMRT